MHCGLNSKRNDAAFGGMDYGLSNLPSSIFILFYFALFSDARPATAHRTACISIYLVYIYAYLMGSGGEGRRG
jgi:hypothetical protein